LHKDTGISEDGGLKKYSISQNQTLLEEQVRKPISNLEKRPAQEQKHGNIEIAGI